MERCWTEIQELDIPLNQDFLVTQYDPELVQAMQDHAAGIQPVSFGLFARTKVMSVEGHVWDSMRRWGAREGHLNTRESDLLRAASDLVPLYRTYEERIKALRTWSRHRARPAGSTESVAELLLATQRPANA